MEIVKAKLDDTKIIIDMIENGRKHIQTFSIDQWINGYPNLDTIINDINNDIGYVCVLNDEIVGYFALLEYDECYEYIEGKWLNDSKYVAVHRCVVSNFDKGLGSLLFTQLKKRYDHIRVDTHIGNISMNKCLLKNGFKKCGTIYLKDGSPRIGYEYLDERIYK